MTQLDVIKQKVNYLYSVSPKIHINVRMHHSSPESRLQNDTETNERNKEYALCLY